MTIYAGYIGIATLGGYTYRITEGNIAAVQDVNAPDVIMGDYFHDAWNYGPAQVGGTISGPLTENSKNLWDWATSRDPCGELSGRTVTINYSCGDSVRVTSAMISSLNLSVSAGDVAQFSVQFTGKNEPSYGSGQGVSYVEAEKLITWDECSCSLMGDGEGFAFDLTWNNNPMPVPVMGEGTLWPNTILGGLVTINGSLSFYNVGQDGGARSWTAYSAEGAATSIKFRLGPINANIKAALHRITPSSNPGVVTSTVGFSGVTHQ